MESVLFYFLILLTKLILTAVIIPEQDEFYVSQEIMKTLLNLLDVFGLNLALEKRVVSETTAKVLAVALGWAAAEAVSNEFLTLVMNASGEEFT